MKAREALASLPKQIKIGLHSYKFKLVKLVSGERPEEAWAQTDTALRLIEICKDHDSSIAVAGTALHEVFHGIWHEEGLGKRPSEERVVVAFERGLVALAQNNPDFMTWMMRCITK